MPRQNSATWDFTVNNYTDADIKWLEEISTDVSRMVVSKEVGEQGTPHLQGRVTFKRAYRWKGIQKVFPHGWHFEMTECDQDSLYCMKADSERLINVDNRRQGQRNDIHEVKSVLGKRRLADIAIDHAETFMRYRAGFKELHYMQCARIPKPVPEVHIRCGPTGTGKTRYIMEKHGDKVVKARFEHGKYWFDEYDPAYHEAIVFDEFYGDLPWRTLLEYTDRYDVSLPVKGAFVPLKARYIYFTSNRDPREWYCNMDMAAFFRRVTSNVKVE